MKQFKIIRPFKDIMSAFGLVCAWMRACVSVCVSVCRCVWDVIAGCVCQTFYLSSCVCVCVYECLTVGAHYKISHVFIPGQAVTNISVFFSYRT